MTSRAVRRLSRLVIFVVALASVRATELRDVPATSSAPLAGEQTILSWRDGPPYLSVARTEGETWTGYSSDRRMLRVETARFSADIDTERVAIAGFMAHPAGRAPSDTASAALAAAKLAPARLDLVVRVRDEVYTCTGRRPVALDRRGQPAEPLLFPVRVVESGRWFQKVALYDLQFRDQDGTELRASAHLEVSIWPDRLALTLVVQPEEPLAAARASVRLVTDGGMDASVIEDALPWKRGAEHRTTLTLGANGAAVPTGAPEGVNVAVVPADRVANATVAWNPEDMCFETRLDTPPWPGRDTGAYPESMLDAWERYAVELDNDSDAPQRVPLSFNQPTPPAIIGCVPMLLDARGTPTGVPVQISKNWHQARDGMTLAFSGPWLHGRAMLEVPAHARLRLQYALTYARWGGVPAASVAQLSLIGWGHNGFWDQFALGSFGESFCLQPLRVQRRALIADFRPLYQLGMAQGERWSWTSNLGGADTLVRYDPQGRYVPAKRNVTQYLSYGPNFAQVAYAEVSADNAITTRLDAMLPRTDDVLRVYLRIRYDVRRRVEFSRLALFQLGADLYNDADSPRVAWGSADGLAAEIVRAPNPADLPRWVARGAQPWAALYGQARDDSARSGQGTRALIVRQWRATLGGRKVDAPTFAATRSLVAKHPLAIELAPPEGVTALEPGDSVDMLLELAAFPISAERYYGPDEGLRAALAEGANTWRPVAREAAENLPTVTGDATLSAGFPLTVAVGAAPETKFVLQGGLGWVPVRLTGIDAPDAVQLVRVTRGGEEPVSQGPVGRPFWQTDYDPATRSWTVMYNLPASGEPVGYVARVHREAPAVAPVR